MTQINDPKLKPCPFCGEDAAIWFFPASERINRKDSYYVACTNDNCGCEMEHQGGWKTYDDAVNAWNHRSNYSEIPTGSMDCISRQAVIDLMMQKWGENFSGDDAMQESIDAIREMPSVTPQEPKIGQWREDIDNNRRWDRVRFYCSECGDWQTYGKSHYCPNCGAKMVEPQESEDI